MRTWNRPELSHKSRTYEKADPNQRLTGLLGRFLRPAILGSVAAFALVVGLIDDGPQFTRLGFAALIGTVLWATAIGFALGTLRLVAGLASIVVAFALTSVGSNARNATGLTEYQSLRSELEIELNLLRGTRLTVREVFESLSGAEASALRGQTVCSDLAAASTWAGASGELAEQLEKTRDELELRLGLIFDAVRSGRLALNLEDRGPPERTRLCEVPVDETSVGQGLGEEADQEEPASASARVHQGEAQDHADAVNAIVEASEEAFGHLEVAGFPRPSTPDRSEDPEAEAGESEADVEPDDAAPMDEAVTQATDAAMRVLTSVDTVGQEPTDGETAERRCVDQVVVSADFAQTLAEADKCVAGCAPRGEGSTCTPQAASRLLLLGFQEQLETLTEDETITEAQQELAARLAEIRSDIAALDAPIAIHELALDGADVILGDAVQKLVLDDGRAARLGGWGWVVLTVASIIGYRLLEIANDRRSPGPVAVKAGESTKETESKTQAAAELVKAHLTAANLQEPSPLPGGEAVSSISTSTDSIGFENAVVKYIVNLLQTTAFPRRGVDLFVTAQPAESGLTPRPSGDGVEPGSGLSSERLIVVSRTVASPAPDLEPYRIMVKATRKSRNGLVFSHPFTGHCLEEVTHSAAYFAAERLLDAGWTTPSWLVWSSQDGSALRAYQEAMIEKQSPRPDGEPRPVAEPSARRRLERAVRSSPGTGAALVALSHEAALEGDFVASAHYLLLARDRHQRFLTARYRLGVTLSMLASDLPSFWNWDQARNRLRSASNGPQAELEWRNHKAGIVDLLEGPTRHEDSDGESEVTEEVLLKRAIDELDFVVRAVQRPRILARASRQAERQYWFSLLRSPRRRSGLRAAAESARALARRRLALLKATSLEQLAEELSACDAENEKAVQRSRDDWLVRYNAACYEATRVHDEQSKGNEDEVAKHRTEAFDHMRRARYARNGQQLSIEWALVDPDLVPLRRSLADDDVWFGRMATTFQVDPAEQGPIRVRLSDLPGSRTSASPNGEAAPSPSPSSTTCDGPGSTAVAGGPAQDSRERRSDRV